MQNKRPLEDRMKEYEGDDDQLDFDMPIIVRVDGVTFSSFTKDIERFSDDIWEAMVAATMKTCEDIGGFVCGYTQSDEASFVLSGFNNPQGQPWFGGKKMKLASVSAAKMTSYFNRYLFETTGHEDIAAFDGRCFNVPNHEEIVNYLIWRQFDCRRNSINMFGRMYFSHKEMHGKSTDKVREMCAQAGHNWNGMAPQHREGTIVFRENYIKKTHGNEVMRTRTKASVLNFVKQKHFLYDLIEKFG